MTEQFLVERVWNNAQFFSGQDKVAVWAIKFSVQVLARFICFFGDLLEEKKGDKVATQLGTERLMFIIYDLGLLKVGPETLLARKVTECLQDSRVPSALDLFQKVTIRKATLAGRCLELVSAKVKTRIKSNIEQNVGLLKLKQIPKRFRFQPTSDDDSTEWSKKTEEIYDN